MELSTDKKLRAIQLKFKIDEITQDLKETNEKLKLLTERFAAFKEQKEADEKLGVIRNETLEEFREARRQLIAQRDHNLQRSKQIEVLVDEYYSIILE